MVDVVVGFAQIWRGVTRGASSPMVESIQAVSRLDSATADHAVKQFPPDRLSMFNAEYSIGVSSARRPFSRGGRACRTRCGAKGRRIKAQSGIGLPVGEGVRESEEYIAVGYSAVRDET